MDPKNNNTETAEAVPEAVETAKLGGQSREEWLAIRKKAGRKINPETAEIMYKHGYALDPYEIGLRGSSPVCQQLQRNYFARSPGSDIWVFFYDLPTATRHALWKKHRAKIVFRLEDTPEDSQTLEEFQREKLKLMEHFCAWLDAGKSLEELEINIDIPVAAGRIPEHARKISNETLDLIRQAREEGADYKEVLAYVQGLAKRDSLL
jgi:hypothetical protein